MFEFEIKSPVGEISKKFLHRYQVRYLHLRRKIFIDIVTQIFLQIILSGIEFEDL